ncbi:hypothetical protein (nucleomorph) [Guillardia theta]|uniref:Uncharacterized protein n=1 Tax=Guillardia theta TaxID=55529 RepID=Q9AQU9_GUITH|nr:hypothetical protein GTHECHR2127 [Guillardia theta]XP_001713333.1 hypothetical protein GTHECHR2191 [Guillardia theta]XP_001713487.1 hypothetical protein GTHECHR3153 [Guillardia theta]XP_001713494.1 hypothetical protein GTHECHR3160 [Guillardia theta]XP_001713645.1 hypothetical protein GTHECHR1147 [Guillardia theta]XP_001713652.1 hypothetical protein GTHECHR1154 [Guillardia theta]AAK39789.1 hypothetical protein [Guillardia theta]AAK39796.1 hypothetical protein [Guillardia theta]AAK39940.1 |mmetsp:Transcript_20150/g.67370  ORF Transcript_20150/g.67370 Transcript_20150/m.67370 type:complete len:211 (+) Transcript_20150:1945-2577(+)
MVRIFKRREMGWNVQPTSRGSTGHLLRRILKTRHGQLNNYRIQHPIRPGSPCAERIVSNRCRERTPLTKLVATTRLQGITSTPREWYPWSQRLLSPRSSYKEEARGEEDNMPRRPPCSPLNWTLRPEESDYSNTHTDSNRTRAANLREGHQKGSSDGKPSRPKTLSFSHNIQQKRTRIRHLTSPLQRLEKGGTSSSRTHTLFPIVKPLGV